MPSPLRLTLLSSALSLTLGCSFFSIENADQPLAKKPAASAGAPGAGGRGGTSSSAGAPGTGGSASGNGGTGGSAAGSGGSGASGAGGDVSVAGGGGSAGSGTMAGAGGSSAGMPPLGGMGGDAMPGAGTGMGGASSGGSAGLDATACMTLSSDAKPFGGHCYLLVTNAVNFAAAKMDCMSKQSHLVTISNGDPASKDTFDAEDMFIFSLGGGKDTWLGLADGKMDTDPGDGTPYVWIDGEPNPPSDWGMAYGWVSGEPNNYQKKCANGATCYEHCGYMVADQGDKWNDDLCEATKQYVCEWDTLPAASQ